MPSFAGIDMSGMRIRRAGLVLLAAFLTGSAAAAQEAAGNADGRAAAAAEETRPLAVGETCPRVSLETPAGEVFDLGTLIGEEPLVLIFYRGGW